MVDPDMLIDRTILVVEEEFLIALDLQRMLEDYAAGQILLARTADEAHELEAHWRSISLAIVEVRSAAPRALALVRQLRDAGIPVVLNTANGALRSGHPDFPDAPVVIKPISEADLAAAIAQALSFA